MHVYEKMITNFPLITERYLFDPKDQLPSNTISIVIFNILQTFDNAQIRKMITQGEIEGTKVIQGNTKLNAKTARDSMYKKIYG